MTYQFLKNNTTMSVLSTFKLYYSEYEAYNIAVSRRPI